MYVEEPEGVQHLAEKGIWYEYNGRHPHWTEDFVGERFSIVAYRKPPKKQPAEEQNECSPSTAPPERS